jgi:hypothetical protein
VAASGGSERSLEFGRRRERAKAAVEGQKPMIFAEKITTTDLETRVEIAPVLGILRHCPPRCINCSIFFFDSRIYVLAKPTLPPEYGTAPKPKSGVRFALQLQENPAKLPDGLR